MQPIADLLQKISPEIKNRTDRGSELSYSEFKQKICDSDNQQRGELTGYDCPDCLNRGYFSVLRGDEIVVRECKCAEVRASIRRIQNSGLAEVLEEYTFDNFKTEQTWQKVIKGIALRFVGDHDGKWLYAGGQVGAGKTHLCTAVAGELLKQGKSVRYMLWRDDSVQLKGCVNDDYEYSRLIEPLKRVDVLYIDDLFKTMQGKAVTQADVNLAFELLNFRYINKHLITILSGEKSVDDLIGIDEAVGSRIYQRSKDYCIDIARDKSRNYRLT